MQLNSIQQQKPFSRAYLWVAFFSATLLAGFIFSAPVSAASLEIEEVIGYQSAHVCKTCHPRHFNEWRVSNHAYGQLSPFMNNFNKLMHQKTSGTAGAFCVRCHSPMAIIMGEDPLAPVELRNTVAIEGITCVVCHRMVGNHGKTRAEVFIKKGPIEEELFGPFDGIKQIPIGREGELTHKASMSKNISSGQFCGQCHDVPVANGFRLEDLFGEWRNSPAAREGTTCQDCHMGVEQGVKSPRAKGQIAVIKGKEFPVRTLSDHTFAGPDYSVLDISDFPLRRFEWPVLMDDPNFYNWIEKVNAKKAAGEKMNRLDKRKWKKYQKLVKKSEELLAMAKRKRVELLRNSAELTYEVPEAIERGDDLDIAVNITNKISGHSLPAGFNTERQVWLHVKVMDDKGKIVYQSGDLDEYGDLKDNKSLAVIRGEADYDHDLFNLQSKFKLQTIAGHEREDHFFIPRDVDNFAYVRPAAFPSASFNGPPPVRVQKNSIPPLKTRTADYSVDTDGSSAFYDVEISFNFRNFAPIVLKQLDAAEFIPRLEIVEMASKKFKVNVR
ncbi:MAG: hypothetical protein G3M78_03845 [Candidatus Nitrohelix vancouverensis]|uniref:Cytochrome c-552/4 domain-containing protein n=1 Tax=Candidatus Nitrohelix vancouverensis TaxID=2705534 RepID=A0A7T0C124_9BACT|nr:MAG: hypothetical protein G3M78_03845 [Candidatus Nitrohelix vancouverensis]